MVQLQEGVGRIEELEPSCTDSCGNLFQKALRDDDEHSSGPPSLIVHGVRRHCVREKKRLTKTRDTPTCPCEKGWSSRTPVCREFNE